MAFLVAKHRLAALPIVAKPNVDCTTKRNLQTSDVLLLPIPFFFWRSDEMKAVYVHERVLFIL